MGESPFAELKIEFPLKEEGLSSRLVSFLGSHRGEPSTSKNSDNQNEHDEPGGGALHLKRSDSGKWLWFARYSNKYLDDDRPREIIAEESHLNYIEEVNRGEFDLPELWIHHIQGTTWGKATWVGYDNGFALAAGYVFPEHSELAEHLSKQSGMLLSHGMDSKSIVRDEKNPHIIIRHNTKEISILPAYRAANKLTGFVVLEENSMEKNKGISQADRRILTEMGISEEWIDTQEAGNKKLSEIAQHLQMPSKQATDEESVETQEENEPEAEAVDTELETEETDIEDEGGEVEEPNSLDDEIVEALVQSAKSLHERLQVLEASNKQIAEVIGQLQEKNEAILGESTKARRMNILSVIGSDSARIDGRSSLAKQSPSEEKSNSNDGLFFWQTERWN